MEQINPILNGPKIGLKNSYLHRFLTSFQLSEEYSYIEPQYLEDPISTLNSSSKAEDAEDVSPTFELLSKRFGSLPENNLVMVLPFVL